MRYALVLIALTVFAGCAKSDGTTVHKNFGSVWKSTESDSSYDLYSFSGASKGDYFPINLRKNGQDCSCSGIKISEMLFGVDCGDESNAANVCAAALDGTHRAVDYGAMDNLSICDRDGVCEHYQ